METPHPLAPYVVDMLFKAHEEGILRQDFISKNYRVLLTSKVTQTFVSENYFWDSDSLRLFCLKNKINIIEINPHSFAVTDLRACKFYTFDQIDLIAFLTCSNFLDYFKDERSLSNYRKWLTHETYPSQS